MKKTTVKLAAVGATALIALTGCGFLAEDSEPVAAPSIEAEQNIEPSDNGGEPVSAPKLGSSDSHEESVNEVTGQGVYQAEMYGGAVATVAAPGEAPEDVEAFRQATGADQVGYLVAEIDNTKGTEEGMIFEARVVDSEGKTYTFTDVSTAIWDWDENFDYYDQEEAITEKYPYSVAPTAKATIPLVGPEVPEDIVSVFIDDVRADKVGEL